MILLSLIALLLFGGSLALVLRAFALPRIKTAGQVEALEAYGYHASRVQTENRSDAAFADLATRIGGIAVRRLKNVRPEQLRAELMAAGIYRLSPQALLGYRVLGFIALGLFGFIIGSSNSFFLGLFLGAGFGGMGSLLPLAVVRRKARFRVDSIEHDLPDLIDLLVVTIEAGLGLAASLQLASTKFDGPLADELRLTLQEQRMGRSMNDALLRMLSRADTAGMRSFVRSVTQGEALGVSIGTIMRNLAMEMRKRRRAAAEEQAQKAPVKMLFPLVFMILPPFLLLLLGPSMFNLTKSIG